MSSHASFSPDPKNARLQLLQSFVRIAGLVWHKPWIKHLVGRFDFILASRPTTYAKMLFYGADAVLVVHHSAAYTPAARLASIPLRWGYGFGGSRR